ncbi:MAG: DMT family transporter [Sneathiellaceae bacterium]
MTGGRALHLAMLLTIALVYGLLFQFNKLARDAAVPEFAYVFWQAALAGVVLLVVSFLIRRPPGVRLGHLRVYLAIGFLGIAFPIWLLTNLAGSVEPGVLTTVLALSPPLTYLFSVLARLDRWRWLGMLGVVLGFVGILIIVGPSNALPSPEHAGLYLLALLAPSGFALANVTAALLRPPESSTAGMAAGVLLGAATMMGVVMLASGTWYTPPATFPSQGDWAILGAACVNVVAIVLFFEIVRVAGPVFFAQFNYLAVVAAIFWAWLIFGSFVDWSVWLALAIMVAGVLLVTLTGQQGPARQAAPGVPEPEENT